MTIEKEIKILIVDDDVITYLLVTASTWMSYTLRTSLSGNASNDF